MAKRAFLSKTIQGLVIMLLGMAWQKFMGAPASEDQLMVVADLVSRSMELVGLGWAGYGLRDAIGSGQPITLK